jgi:LAO/AO transport system kinase
MTLAERVIKGHTRAAARLISLLENDDPQATPEMDSIYPHIGRAAIIGVTGAPGTGKTPWSRR